MRRGTPVPATGTPAGPGISQAPPPRPVTPPGAFQEAVPSSGPQTASIARLGDDAPFSYGDLRARGIALAQAASGQLWTDYNLHDPGVTLLESLCYALTEGVFGAEADVADLLTAPDGRIHYRRHALHGAEEALPCRPTTELDWLRWLLDRVPAVRQLRLRMPDADGLWRMALRVGDGDGAAAARDVARAFRAQRNLAEDMDGAPHVLRPRWCALDIHLSVDGPRDPGDVLVEVVRRCADIVSAAPRRQPLQARLAQRDAAGNVAGTAELFDGPAVQCGWIEAEDLRRDPANRLHFSDLAHALREIDGVADISALRLVPLDATADAEAEAEADDAPDSLPWHGTDWALQLRWPEDSMAVAAWQVTRRGSQLHLDTRALLARLADARQAARLSSTAPRATRFAGQLLKRPAGRYLPDTPYLSIWHHLPPLYRQYHAAPRADAESQAQFGAYLALLEQWLAHGSAQMQHLRQLFSIEREPARSYWWAPLGQSDVPGLAGVHTLPQEAEAAQLARDDDALDRRSRVLDLMLALHGESCDQHSIQRFGVYYDAAGWQRHLYDCKRRFAQRIVRHTRDRGGAFDDSRPSLGRKGNTAPLQERVGLLLGLEQTHSRLLAGVPGAHGIALDNGGAPDARAPLAMHGVRADAPEGVEPLVMWPPLRARIAAHLNDDMALGEVGDRLAYHFPALAPRALPAPLLRCAAHAGRYHRVATQAGDALWLGPDETGHWWPLPVRHGPGGVIAPALYLHELACRVQREAEGLHLVEHILLRPLGGSGMTDADADVPADFYRHRISLILPGWTARGADHSFRDLARETIALGCPAHILPTVHWLELHALAAFEQDFSAWLAARVAYAEAGGGPDATSRLDACAQRLRGRLAAMDGPRTGAAR